jgi:hypothetical protein
MYCHNLQYKKYPNPFAGKAKLLAVISIVLIITISYGIFFYLENTTEQNVRNSVFEQQLQNQLKDTEALSRHTRCYKNRRWLIETQQRTFEFK